MSNILPAQSTAFPVIAPVRTIDDVMALLRVNEGAVDVPPQEGDDSAPPNVPWVGFRSPKSKSKLEELIAAKVEENTFYLYENGVIYPKPFFIHLMAGLKYLSVVDNKNKEVRIASGALTTDLKKQKFSDAFLALVLVRLPGETPMYKAATLKVRSALVRALDSIRKYTSDFEKDKEGREWKTRGPAHAKAFEVAKWPTFALRARIWGKTEPTSSGEYDINLGMSSVEPTPIEEVRALNRYMGFEPETYGGENKKNTEWAAALKLYGKRRKEILAGIAESEAEKDTPADEN